MPRRDVFCIVSQSPCGHASANAFSFLRAFCCGRCTLSPGCRHRADRHPVEHHAPQRCSTDSCIRGSVRQNTTAFRRPLVMGLHRCSGYPTLPNDIRGNLRMRRRTTNRPAKPVQPDEKEKGQLTEISLAALICTPNGIPNSRESVKISIFLANGGRDRGRTISQLPYHQDVRSQ
ncbi:MAG: hypothetical protein JWQ98_2712 [Chlorobi bacterium]|nr:hypothetical protein [Chlorobiota bacterium]